MSTNLAVVTPQAYALADIQQMAAAVAGSGLFPALKQPNQALALMLLCQSKGLHPMEAVERYHVVQGRPVMRADAMLSEFIQGGGRVEWHERTDKIANATFSHPQGGSVRVAWTMEMAKAANLTNKDVWRQYPRQMLHARCVSEGVRSVLPGATNGLYTPEEAQDMTPVRAEVVVEQTPVVESAPAVDRDLVAAMRGFAAAASESGEDITDPKTGKPSKSLMESIAASVMGGAVPQTPAEWRLAADALAGRVDDAPVAEVVDPELAEIEDPFAKSEEA